MREVRFSNQKFAASTLVSNIKYNHLGFLFKYPFYPFHDQINYVLAHYLALSETTKDNVNMFLSKPLMVLFTKRLSYQNADA